ncbi:hypothetical protein CW304_01365 [Bacillus sp. UFRGS-B20]|nr:hypothetical protein CW304_01365 [Bacillus sp. UFRGS-B20]
MYKVHVHLALKTIHSFSSLLHSRDVNVSNEKFSPYLETNCNYAIMKIKLLLYTWRYANF